MNATRIEYDVGETVHRQPLRLVFEKTTGGAMAWTLHKDPASQRDDSTFVSGIPSDVILKMAEAVRSQQGRV